MPDEVRLSARLWLPKSAHDVPVGAVLEYIPYRKADMVRARDARNHPFLAENGFAALRVDMRGSGDSEGHMPDMYDSRELDDARHVIRWIANQPWCNGRVGMFGTSWGGTAALQANIDAPEELKAVIAVCATHDRYEDDIHHMGGAVLTDTVEWGATLPAILASPPTPGAGEDWYERWMERLDRLTFPLEAWLREEDAEPYWAHGSVIRQADRLSRPMLAIGGWADRYSNSVMALSEARPDLVYGIVGPWGHHYPDVAEPGPGIGFQQVALDWWRHWLSGADNGVSRLPRLRTWMRGFDAPVDRLKQRVGGWIETDPAERGVEVQNIELGDALVALDPKGAEGWSVPDDLKCGSGAGDTGYFGRVGGLPLDQNLEDRGALTFETVPLEEPVVLHGRAQLSLDATAAAQRGQLVLRLTDVAPDGRANRIVLAVTRSGPTGCGRPVMFPSMTYRLEAGHRLRLAIASSCWPMIWPAPEPAGILVVEGSLSLPVISDPVPLSQPFPKPMDLPAEERWEVLDPGTFRRWADVTETGQRHDGWEQTRNTVRHHDVATDFSFATRADHHMDPNDPLTAKTSVDHQMTFARPDGTAEVQSRVTMTSSASSYDIRGELTATWEGEDVRARSWQFAVPRKKA